MSIIRAIKHRLGLSVTPANNFVLDASADNGTMKLARESGQDIMTVDAAGKVAFSIGILGFSVSLAADRYAIKFPTWMGSACIQGGSDVSDNVGNDTTVTLVYALQEVARPVVSNGDGAANSLLVLSTYSGTISAFNIAARVSNSAVQPTSAYRANWFCIGRAA